MEKTLTILGAGSWGTALSIVLAPRFERTNLWVFEQDLAERMRTSRINDVYLADSQIPDSVAIETSLQTALGGAEIVLGVMPSKHVRRLFTDARPFLHPDAILVSATKGIEQETLLRMSEVIASATGSGNIAVLSGPTFAKEIARGEPAAVVIASEAAAIAERVQAAFSGPTFRLYTNPDVTGVELGAALKNVIAIGAGVCEGLGLGNNSMAALITRGLAEITRLSVAMGGNPKTLAGLAGLGDLVLTCTGDLSRNRTVGIELAKGRKLKEIMASRATVAEGIFTCSGAVALGAKFGVDLPIIAQMDLVLNQGKSPREALRDLMERSLKAE